MACGLNVQNKLFLHVRHYVQSGFGPFLDRVSNCVQESKLLGTVIAEVLHDNLRCGKDNFRHTKISIKNAESEEDIFVKMVVLMQF